MHLAAAQDPRPPAGADRIIHTTNAVAILDGASAHHPIPVAADVYVDTLATHLRTALEADATTTDGLAGAIEATCETWISPRATPPAAPSPSSS